MVEQHHVHLEDTCRLTLATGVLDAEQRDGRRLVTVDGTHADPCGGTHDTSPGRPRAAC